MSIPPAPVRSSLMLMKTSVSGMGFKSFLIVYYWTHRGLEYKKSDAWGTKFYNNGLLIKTSVSGMGFKSFLIVYYWAHRGLEYRKSDPWAQIASPVQSQAGFAWATVGTVGITWTWASPVKSRMGPMRAGPWSDSGHYGLAWMGPTPIPVASPFKSHSNPTPG